MSITDAGLGSNSGANEERPYEMALDLNVLNHLGLNLYSNVAAVVSEIVANSWDADAHNVRIDLNLDADEVLIRDDGRGMTRNDINRRYLLVGYDKRHDPDEGGITAEGRRPMGRKGIGKLSLFSIARTVRIYSIKNGERNAFEMRLQAIEDAIKSRGGVYYPIPIEDWTGIALDVGTLISLSDLKGAITRTAASLKRRVARRFSIIGADKGFTVQIGSQPVSIQDRDYFHKFQFVWWYGDPSTAIAHETRNAVYSDVRSGSISEDWTIRGWIATVQEPRQLKDGDENLNRIVVMMRGKLAHEDILESISDGGLYTKYIIGEIEADFLDDDNADDIATSSRQSIKEDDERFIALRTFLRNELRHIETLWTEKRNEQGTSRALDVPAIKGWFETLGPDSRRRAQQLFGRINRFPMENESERDHLFEYAVLAFESLRLKDNLSAIDRLGPDDLVNVAQVFGTLDDLEAALYLEIVRQRMAVIRKLRDLVDTDAKERVVQEHLFDHLWLLDAAWERATDEPADMEHRFSVAFKADDPIEKERLWRYDIRFKTIAGSHVIVELKRPERVCDFAEDLLPQIFKYSELMRTLLATTGNRAFEIVVVLGKLPRGWTDNDVRRRGEETLRGANARVVFYEELIERALQAYADFSSKERERGRIEALLDQIRSEVSGQSN